MKKFAVTPENVLPGFATSVIVAVYTVDGAKVRGELLQVIDPVKSFVSVTKVEGVPPVTGIETPEIVLIDTTEAALDCVMPAIETNNADILIKSFLIKLCSFLGVFICMA